MNRDPDGLSWKGYEGQDYENFWAGHGKRNLDQLERCIASHALPGGESVVEIGAGFGRMGSCYVGKYKTVHMVDVFHHLGRPDLALREIHRILRPAGRLVFNFSNKRNLKRIVQYALGRAKNPFTRDMDEYAATLIGHHPRSVEHLLSEVGFKIVEQFGVGVMDKIVDVFPAMTKVLSPSLSTSRFLGRLKLAPAQFVVA